MGPSSTGNPWFAVSMALFGVIVGYGIGTMGSMTYPTGPAPSFVNNPTPTPTPAPGPEPVVTAENMPPIDPETDHIRGNKNAKITLVEYSDYECPFCERHHPTMQQVMDAYGDDVNWVFRHFPLSFHPNAEPGAIASECVAELGGNDAFWKFTDDVFKRTNGFNFEAYATAAGVDATKFKACVSSGKHKQTVTDQMNGGSAAGVNGTPGTIVLNNETKESQVISGAVPFSNFQSVIDGMLN